MEGFPVSFITSISPYVVESYAKLPHNNGKNQILDPISTAIRLGLLCFKPQYTKLNISHNRIYFQEPSIFQGIIRRVCGDNRSNINIVIECIQRFTQWYNMKHYQIRYICERMLDGLLTLKTCYDNTSDKLVSQTIVFFVDTIRRELPLKNGSSTNTLSTTGNPSTTTTSLVDTPVDVDSKYESTHNGDWDGTNGNGNGGGGGNGKSGKKKKRQEPVSILSVIPETEKDLQTFFRSHWTEQEINVLYHLIREMNQTKDKDKSYCVGISIENLIEYKDTETRKYIRDMITYT